MIPAFVKGSLLIFAMSSHLGVKQPRAKTTSLELYLYFPMISRSTDFKKLKKL